MATGARGPRNKIEFSLISETTVNAMVANRGDNEAMDITLI